ncbi:MAG: hypothetical protein KatS3mg039_1435 [Candidatus Kapaibacterium sp.]|nr:MAG: hypothetical protein KatS3mg039_1435 [Candidatus Kapabacteria bacterium]
MQDVAVAIVMDTGRVLIGKRRQGTRYQGVWEFPGGKVEPGESPVDALRREVQEELGITAHHVTFLTATDHRYSDGGHFRVWYFLVTQWEGTPSMSLWEEHAWVSPDVLEGYALFDANRRILPQLRQYLDSSQDERFMFAALEQAELAAQRGEVPVGCVIVRQGNILAATHNRTEELSLATAHAEVLAIAQACATTGSKWLGSGTTLYVTLEPCPMCAGAIVLARIERVVFGAHDPKAGACETLYTITSDRRLNHRAVVRGGVCADQARVLLQTFFDHHRTRQ